MFVLSAYRWHGPMHSSEPGLHLRSAVSESAARCYVTSCCTHSRAESGHAPPPFGIQQRQRQKRVVNDTFARAVEPPGSCCLPSLFVFVFEARCRLLPHVRRKEVHEYFFLRRLNMIVTPPTSCSCWSVHARHTHRIFLVHPEQDSKSGGPAERISREAFA